MHKSKILHHRDWSHGRFSSRLIQSELAGVYPLPMQDHHCYDDDTNHHVSVCINSTNSTMVPQLAGVYPLLMQDHFCYDHHFSDGEFGDYDNHGEYADDDDYGDDDD